MTYTRYICLACELAGKRSTSLSVAWMQTHLRNQHYPCQYIGPSTVRTESVPDPLDP